MVSKLSFTLSPGHWYGWQMLPGYAAERNVPYFSPIWLQAATPRKTGRRLLTLKFFNVLYAEGVQDFTLDLRVLKHEANYFVAELVYQGDLPQDRTAIVSHIEFEWLRRFCPNLWAARPPESFGPNEQHSVQNYLKALFGPLPDE